MRRVVTVLLLVILTLAIGAPPAEACGECVALGLASFAIFTQLVAAIAAPPVVHAAPAYYAPAYYGWPYSAAPAATQGWTGPRVVQYAHGRYELRGDGVTVPWSWVWIPTAPPAPLNPDGPEGVGGSRAP
jgi:hypothetical protein